MSTHNQGTRGDIPPQNYMGLERNYGQGDYYSDPAFTPASEKDAWAQLQSGSFAGPTYGPGGFAEGYGNIDITGRYDIPDASPGAVMDITRQHVPDVNLLPYLKSTQVDIPEGLRGTIDLTNQLISGDVGNFRQLLEGELDLRQLDKVQAMDRRDFREFTTPSILDARSSGPFGQGLHSGGTDRAVSQAASALHKVHTEQRFQASEAAKERAIKAASILPSLAGIQDTERINNIKNLERDISTHFGNEDIKLQNFKAQFDRINQGLALAGFHVNTAISEAQLWQKAQIAEMELNLRGAELGFNQDLAMENLRLQLEQMDSAERGSRFGMMGSLLGAAAGVILAPATGGLSMMAAASLGASLGGGVGQSLGGGGSSRLSGAVSDMPLQLVALSDSGMFDPKTVQTPSSTVTTPTIQIAPSRQTTSTAGSLETGYGGGRHSLYGRK